MIDLADMDVGEKVMKEVAARLHAREQHKCHMAIAKQRLAAKAGGERTIQDGSIKFAITPEFYHYWGQRLGYACWEDKQFVEEFLRDNPECRVKSKTGRIQEGYRGGETGNSKLETGGISRRGAEGAETRVKFRKVYREEDYKRN